MELLVLKNFNDDRGTLVPIDSELPFTPKRIYTIFGSKQRGGHRHKKNQQLLVCLQGSCTVYVNNGKEEREFVLPNPATALYLLPEDWHLMKNFSEDSILLVIASEPYDVNDYIDEPYGSL